MKKILIFICILFSLRVNCFSLSFPQSALDGSFSENRRLSSLSFTSHDKNDDQKDAEEEADSMFAWLIALGVIAVGVAYYWLNTVRFFDYPYQDDENVSPADGKYIARGSLEGLIFTDPGYNRNRFALDTSLIYLHDFGLGNETRFEGLLFPYFGPYFENLALYNFHTGDFDFLQKGFRDNVKVGGQISVLQTDILSALVLIQYTTWRGEGFSDFRTGCNFGVILRSYPIKPLVLEWKMGSHNYKHGFMVFESNLQLGIMRKAYEIFASWKFIDFSHEDEDESFGSFHGFTV